MYWQPEGSSVIEPGDLANALARRIYKFITGPAVDYVRFAECRRFGGLDLLSFDIRIERPQNPVYDIHAVESVTVCLPISGQQAFSVLVARPDFPDTPHQNLTPEGIPCCICIDDRPWQDTGSTYTAAEFVGRLSAWFEKACQGELHGAGQPLDPLFVPGNTHEIVLTSGFWKAADAGNALCIWAVDEEARCLFISDKSPGNLPGDDIRLMALHCRTDAQRMSRMKRAPVDLGQLNDFLAASGVDLCELLHCSIGRWVNGRKELGDGKRLICLLVTMPQIDPNTNDVGSVETVAFVFPVSPGELGERMGFLISNVSGQAMEVNFVPRVGGTPSIDAARGIPVVMSFVHTELDGAKAARLSGSDHADERRLLMIGAGSAGSTISETLVRQGLFKWSIIDDDILLPHNVARHSLNNAFVGHKKAVALANRLNQIREDIDVQALVDNVLFPAKPEELKKQIAEAALILDASASVPVSRWLSDLDSCARRICAFFTPDGRSAVLMIEDEARTLKLRDLEAAYIREIMINPALKTHLGAVERMNYTGACRALTNRIPMSAIQTLSGLIAAEIAEGTRRAAETLKVWTMTDEGISLTPITATTHSHADHGWCVSMPASLTGELTRRRQENLPNETGGSLMGMIDYNQRRIDIIDALFPPDDSVATPSSFTRGTSKLKGGIDAAAARTGYQVRYIGEWHSHPRGRSASPSVTDRAQIRQLGEAMQHDDLPAISLIVAEGETSILIDETGTADGR